MLQITISKRAAVFIVLALILVIPGIAGATHVFLDVGDGSTGLGGNTNTGVALQIAMASENMEDFDKAGNPPPIVGGVATPTTDTYR